MRLADYIRVGDFLAEIEAGGPGSGRHPGPGEGNRPGSGRPFGVSPGIHKVLTDAGYKHKGSARSADSTGLHQTQWYQHPSGDHALVQDGHNWSTHGPGIKGTSPLVLAPPAERFGQNSGILKQALANKHGDVAAGGPGSGRRPGGGFGDAVRKFADTITGHPKVGPVMAPKPAAAPVSFKDRLSNHFTNQMEQMPSTTPSVAAPKPSFKERLGNAIMNHPLAGSEEK